MTGRPRGRRPNYGASDRSDDGPAPGPGGRLTVALVGFGRVGRALARRWVDPPLPSTMPPRFRVVAVLDSHHCVADPRGVDLPELWSRKERTGRLAGPGAVPWSFDTVLSELSPDIVVETTWSEPRPGEPGRRHVLGALLAGADVVTSNKGPLARHSREVLETARHLGRELRFGTTVGGIVPVLECLGGSLRGTGVVRVTAVVNGTTQYVLGRLADGSGWSEALQAAVRAGITEPDPRWDLEGHDAAMKASILHHVIFASGLRPEAVAREGIDSSIEVKAHSLRSRSKRLVSLTEVSRGSASVGLQEVDRSSPWDLPSATNRFEIETERAGTLCLCGLGAGPEATAAGLWAEMEEIADLRERLLLSSKVGTPAGMSPIPSRLRAEVGFP